ncbi:glycoside hydrolase superfamily [Mycena epipterygia]|nr:glycoside hydrolase superfamily [Mycena epipterygia]
MALKNLPQISPSSKHVRSFNAHSFSRYTLVAAGSMHRVARSLSKSNNSIVQLFEWPWESVAAECTSFLGPAGYGFAQVSPASEHIKGDQWWTDYQPVFISSRRSEGPAQFANMVSTCKNAGVGILLVGLSDLGRGQSAVQNSIAAYLKDLQSLGVSGFRMDAAKHIEPADLAAICSKRDGSDSEYITQEVTDGGGSPPSQYVSNEDVIEFGATNFVSNLVTPVPMTTAWGLVDSDVANLIMSNQDTE